MTGEDTRTAIELTFLAGQGNEPRDAIKLGDFWGFRDKQI